MHQVQQPALRPGHVVFCTLVGRFVFANNDKNIRLREKQARAGDGK